MLKLVQVSFTKIKIPFTNTVSICKEWRHIYKTTIRLIEQLLQLQIDFKGNTRRDDSLNTYVSRNKTSINFIIYSGNNTRSSRFFKSFNTQFFFSEKRKETKRE